jgi:hypothetical protein
LSDFISAHFLGAGKGSAFRPARVRFKSGQDADPGIEQDWARETKLIDTTSNLMDLPVSVSRRFGRKGIRFSTGQCSIVVKKNVCIYYPRRIDREIALALVRPVDKSGSYLGYSHGAPSRLLAARWHAGEAAL